MGQSAPHHTDPCGIRITARPPRLRPAPCVRLHLAPSAGSPPAQVAEWAGHSVAVLLKVYAKCIDGQDQIAKRRIEDALRETDDEATDHRAAEDSGDAEKD